MSEPRPMPDGVSVCRALAERGVELLPQQADQWMGWICRQATMLNLPNGTHAALGESDTWARMIKYALEYAPHGPATLGPVQGQALAASVYGILEGAASAFSSPNRLAENLEMEDSTVLLPLAVYSQVATRVARSVSLVTEA